jgi:DNA-binding protein H-NS
MAKRKASGRPRRRRESIPGTKQQASRRDNLASMSVDALLALRDNVGAVLSQRTAELQRQVQRLGITGRTATRAKRSGGKIPPKYRDPDNPANTWAGRGAIPKWMAGKLKKGATREDFLIGASTRKKRSAKKTSRRAKTNISARGSAKTRSKRALRAARPRSATASIPNGAAGSNRGSPPE